MSGVPGSEAQRHVPQSSATQLSATQLSATQPTQSSGTQPTQSSGTQPTQSSGTQPTQSSGTQPTQSSPPQLSPPQLSPTRPTRPPRTIWQPKQPVFWLFLVLLVVSVVLTVLELVLAASNLQAAGAALVLVFAQAALLVLIVRAMPRFKRQPGSLRLAALAWGLFIIPAVAIIANTSAGELIEKIGLGSFSASLSAPINEDLIRLIGVLAVLTLAQPRRFTVMDGAVYGFIVGAGFEVVENLLYSLRGEDFSETLSVGVTRLLIGFGLHALWTSVAGAGLAYCLARRQQRVPARWWVLAPTVGVPMLLHAGWDSPEFSIISFLKILLFVVLYVLSVGAFLFAVRWGRRSEYAWFVETQGSTLSYKEFLRLPKAERREIAAAAVAEESAETPLPANNEAQVRGEQAQTVEASDPRS